MLMLKCLLLLGLVLLAVDAAKTKPRPRAKTNARAKFRKIGGESCGDHKEGEFWPCDDGCNFCSCYQEVKWQTAIENCPEEHKDCDDHKHLESWTCPNLCKTKCYCMNGDVWSSEKCLLRAG